MAVTLEYDLHQNKDTSILLENFDPNNIITRSRKKREITLLQSEIL